MTVYVGAIERDVVTIAGSEAADYLQGQISQDVPALAIDDSAWTFVLSPQGKVDGWGRVHRVDAEVYELDVDPGAGADVAARLQRFLLRTKADVTLQESVPGVAVRGVEPADALPLAGVDGVGGDLLRAKVGDLPAEVLDDAAQVDDAGLDAVRVLAGVPAWGREIDHDTIPATLGQWVIESSVSFTKGCYTGQELVARIDSRGGNVPRRLCGFTTDGAGPAGGDAVVVEGKEVGVVTSDALDPTTGQPIGLAFVQRNVEVPADATIGGNPVRLVPLPFASADR
jgi:folate-binding protein YgfZ